MKLVEFTIATGFVGGDITEIMEYDDDVTSEEIWEDLEAFRDEHISSWAMFVNEEGEEIGEVD